MRMLIIAVAGVVTAVSARAAPPGLEVYGRLPNIEQIEISPDGSRLAIVQTDGESRVLIIRDAKTNAAQKAYPASQLKIRDIRWAGPEHVLLTTSSTQTIMDLTNPRAEWLMAFDLDISAGKARSLMEGVGPRGVGTNIPSSTGSNATMNTVVAPPSVMTIDGAPVVFLQGVSFPDRRGVLTLFRSELNNRSAKLVETGAEETVGMVIGANGKVLADKRVEKNGAWSIRMRTPTGPRELVAGVAGSPQAALLGMGRTADSVLIQQYGEGGAVALHEANAQGLNAPLSQADGMGPVFDPVTSLALGFAALSGDDRTHVFFAERDQKVWNAVVKAFPGEGVSLVSWSNDRQRIVVRVDSPIEGPGFALADIATKSASWIGPEYAGLERDGISPVRPVAFKARDGLQLSGYLTLPRGKPDKNLPLVVFPHGGPGTRDVMGFDWWAQAMAARGYAVLKVNYRGSTGFGRAFRDAGVGEWGGKMQTDLSDGVHYLSAQGLIDPKRVCIVGGSYGGYAALAGATLDRGVYRCAVSYAGVTDLPRMVTYVRSAGGERSRRSLQQFLGVEASSDPVLAQRSPARQAPHADIPVLLIHGKDDTIVPLAQSQMMQEALNRAGKPTELIVLDGEDHWLTSGKTRLAMLTATMAFVEKNNPPN